MTRLPAAFAIWGLAIGISLAPLMTKPAPPGQLPGYAAAIGLDAHAPFRFYAAIIALTLALPLMLRPIARRLAPVAWASNATIAACIVALWFVVIERNFLWTFVPALLAIVAFTLLARVELRFTRRDWILIPTFLTTFMAVIDVARDIQVQRATIVALAIVLALRIAVAFIPSPLPPALAFLIAPLGLLLQTGFFARDQRYFGWHALLIVVITPFVLRVVLRNERRAVQALAFVVYPLVAFAYTNAMSMPVAEGKYRISIFEASHSLPMASEYLRGERPYLDDLPVHGLGEDGGIDLLAFRISGVTAGSALRLRFLLGILGAAALYALGAAMTGVPEAGLAVWLFATLIGWNGSARALPALIALALIACAIRKRDTRYLIAAGAGAVLCGINSLDYALYTFLALVVAVVRFQPKRLAIKHTAIGLAAAAVPLFLGFAIFGILDDFIRGTFFEVVSFGPAYTLSLFTPPRSFAEAGSFPEFLPSIFRAETFPYLIWGVIAVATAVLLARPRRRRYEPFVIVGLWIVLAAISYAERHHLYFMPAVAPMLVGGAYIAIRRRAALAPVLVASLLILSMPTVHIGIVGWVRRLRGPAEEGWTEVRDIPRARGVLMPAADAAELASAKKYADLALQRDETFVDFTNRAAWYYFLNRDLPLRHVEVAYYESEQAQREVIATIERNPRIRAALVPPGGTAVDGVANELRAPLVWDYLQQHFTPDFEEGRVVFWRRR
jgi:hypothetical protein